MPRCLRLILCFLALGTGVLQTTHAQNHRNDHWVLGQQMHLQFGSGQLETGVLPTFETFEASAAISDPNDGRLVLYSNSVDLWNGRHERLTDKVKLKGHLSSSQGVLIMPEVCNQYYVFTTAGYRNGPIKGLYYSLVDMSLRGGGGDFVPGKINVPLLALASEKLTATHHFDRQSFWLLCHGILDNKFYAFHVDGNGIGAPVISEIGMVHGTSPRAYGAGNMKVSPDGSKLALAELQDSFCELFDFDNRTGRVSNNLSLIQNEQFYGVEFSPDSRKLYVASFPRSANSTRLRQFDLDAPNIPASEFIVHESPDPARWLGGMQLAPDGKIYVAIRALTEMYAISAPNRAGAACDLTLIPLANGTRTQSGMINLYTGAELQFPEPEPHDLTVIADTSICQGESVLLLAESKRGGRYKWQPREGLSDPDAQSPQAWPQRTTTYVVSVSDVCGSEVDTVTIFVRPTPELNVAALEPICPGESVQLEVSGGDEYRWEPAEGLDDPTSATPIASSSKTTQYTVYSSFEDGCERSADVRVIVYPGPDFDLGPDRIICQGESAQLRASGGTSYRWWPNEEISAVDVARPTVRPSTDRSYYVEVTDDAGCTRIDSVHISVGSGISLPAGGALSVCAGEEVLLAIDGPDGPGVEYRWSPSTGLDDPNIKQPRARPTSDITYTVRVIADCGSSEGELLVRVIDKPQYVLGDLEVCAGQALELNPNADPALEYVWDRATEIEDLRAANPLVKLTQAATFYLTIRNGTGNSDCEVRDSVRVSIIDAPALQVSDDLRMCAGENVNLNVAGAAEYSWSPAEFVSDIGSDSPTAFPPASMYFYVHAKTAGGCENLDSVFVEVLPMPELRLIPEAPEICPGESFKVQNLANSALRSVRWTPTTGLDDPGSLEPVITLFNSQIYIVEFESEDGCRGQLEYSVQVAERPQLELSARSLDLCRGAEELVSVGGADVYEWYDADGRLLGTGDSRLISFGEGMYQVIGFNAAGCADSASIEVNNLPGLDMPAEREIRLCFGETATLQAEGAMRYEWEPTDQFSDPTAEQVRITPESNQEYLLRGFDANGCEDSTLFRVNLVPRVDIALQADVPAGGALPGDEIVVRLDFTIRDASREFLDQQFFDLELQYERHDLQYVTGSLVNISGLDGWTLNASERAADKTLKLEARSDGKALTTEFSLELRMHVLLITSDQEAIALNISSSNFYTDGICGELGTTNIPLSEFCLRGHRGIDISGVQFGLMQNRPNPVQHGTEIIYSLGFDTHITIVLTDHLGRQVHKLIDAEQTTGVYRLYLNTDDLAAGTYRYNMLAGPFSKSFLLVVE